MELFPPPGAWFCWHQRSGFANFFTRSIAKSANLRSPISSVMVNTMRVTFH